LTAANNVGVISKICFGNLRLVLPGPPNTGTQLVEVEFADIRSKSKCLTAFLVVMVAGCSQQAVKTAMYPHSATDPKPYVVGADDVLDVIVWNQPQLSGKMRVAGDGTITIPLAGQVAAAGLTCEALQTKLREKLARYTDNPSVVVRVAEPLSKVFYVVGEVRKAGVYRLHAGEVLSQGLAEAGGFNDFANRSAIKVVRRTPSEDVEMAINYNRIEKGDLTADIPLQPGDTITVP
jgi:polysaccharide biosynthesis/export protein